VRINNDGKLVDRNGKVYEVGDFE